METPIARERRGAVAVLRLVHGRANALDVELCEALVEALAAAESEGAAAVVLTGGGPIFSAGVDLRRVLAGGADYLRAFLPALRTAFERLALCELPVVAAVNGHAIAGGFVLLAAADQALMAGGDGRIGVTELLVGVPFPTIALELVRQRAGTRQAAELAYRGLTCQPAEAAARGLVDEVVEPDRLLDRSVELAAALATAGQAFALTKRQLRQPLADALAAGTQYDAEVEETWCREPTLTAMRRYADAVLSRGAG
jgi:enoyl-CoA hydratase